MLRVVSVCGAVPLALLAGCMTPLERYIADKEYTPFVIPRADDGVGTIVRFESKRDIAVARAAECLKDLADTAANPSNRRPVALEDTTYEIEDNDTLELSIPKEALGGKVDLSAAFKINRVRTVKITFIKPFECIGSDVAIQDALDALQKAGRVNCTEQATADGNYIIAGILGAEGVDYSFYDESNIQIELDAEIMKKLTAKAEIQQKYTGKNTLSLDQTMYFGYHLYRAKKLPGAAEVKFKAQLLSPDQVSAIAK